ncbi:hypothetical protein LSH36_1000g00029 [Paralvinella palmiformis]|uniref:Chloride channel protein n=1 Tax=Paralvinella palmiformis TaxID=53620 RepID=A0AAD9IW39_9ANNE|nr:hypothetical protein LSH36_1000g00029 [Paralvinella palmiformis]
MNRNSQDYDQCENKLFMEEQENERSLKVRRKWMARWIVNLLTGIGTALVATVIEIGIEYVAHYKFWLLRKLVVWCDTGWRTALPLLYWIVVNCCLVFLGSSLVTFIEVNILVLSRAVSSYFISLHIHLPSVRSYSPQAVGSGIPQIKCYLNGVKIPGLLTLRALIAKSFGVILSVSGGLACGKEGPMIHSGAIVAAGVSQGRSKMLKTDFKIFEYLRSDTERRDFVSGGAAAGVSAAFGAPVGGLLFSLEEGASFWNQSLTWRIVFASMIATFTVNVLLSAIHGHPADLSNPGLISFGRFSHITYQAIEIPIFLLMGVLGKYLYYHVTSDFKTAGGRYIANNWLKVLEAMLVSAISAVMGFTLIFLVNDCVPDDARGHHDESVVKLYCSESEHNVMSAIFFKTPEQTLIAILHDNMGSYTVLTLSLFVCLYFLLACWTYGLSVSSGIFIPCLLTGATWGRLVGMGVMYLFPTMVRINVSVFLTLEWGSFTEVDEFNFENYDSQ